MFFKKLCTRHLLMLLEKYEIKAFIPMALFKLNYIRENGTTQTLEHNLHRVHIIRNFQLLGRPCPMVPQFLICELLNKLRVEERDMIFMPFFFLIVESLYQQFVEDLLESNHNIFHVNSLLRRLSGTIQGQCHDGRKTSLF